MLMRSRVRWIVPLAAAAVLVGGCSGNDKAGPTSETLATMNPDATVFSLSQTPDDATTPSGSESSVTPGNTKTVSSTVTSGPAPSSSTAPTGSTSSSGSGGTTSRPTTTSPATSTKPTGSSGTKGTRPTTSAKEAADRKAAEAAWIGYWAVYDKLPSIPPAKRHAALAKVAVDPLLKLTVESAAISDENNTETWGVLKHRFSWKPEINGSDLAMFNDCLDQSNYGGRDRTTKKVTSRGIAQREIRVTARRGDDAKWRIERYDPLGDGSC